MNIREVRRHHSSMGALWKEAQPEVPRIFEITSPSGKKIKGLLIESDLLGAELSIPFIDNGQAMIAKANRAVIGPRRTEAQGMFMVLGVRFSDSDFSVMEDGSVYYSTSMSGYEGAIDRFHLTLNVKGSKPSSFLFKALEKQGWKFESST